MEKQNRLPKMNILTAICERLNIPTERIVENNGNGINDQFNTIVNDLISGKLDSAEDALNKIPVKKLESDFDKQRYYYLLGMVQVNSDKIDEAIFNFELVLTQFATTSANIYLAMTTAGMALAYYKRNDPERAQRLTDRAVRLIDNKKLIGSLQSIANLVSYTLTLVTIRNQRILLVEELNFVANMTHYLSLMNYTLSLVRMNWHWVKRKKLSNHSKLQRVLV